MASQNFVTRPGSQFVQSGTGAVERTVTNKLEDIISVKDFGADPTGQSDSSAAIQAAIDAAGSQRRVYIPGGKYLIQETIYLTIGSRIFGDPGGVAEESLAGFSEGTTLYLSTTKADGSTWTTSVINPSNETYAGRVMFTGSPSGGACGFEDILFYSLGANTNNSTAIYCGGTESTVPYERGFITQFHGKGLRFFTFNRVVHGSRFDDAWLIDCHSELCTTVFSVAQGSASGWSLHMANCLWWRSTYVFQPAANVNVSIAAANCAFSGADSSHFLLSGSASGTAKHKFLLTGCDISARMQLRDTGNVGGNFSLVMTGCRLSNNSLTVVEEGATRIDTISLTGCTLTDYPVSINYNCRSYNIQGNTFTGSTDKVNLKGGSNGLILGNDWSQCTTASPLVNFEAGVISSNVLIADNSFNASGDVGGSTYGSSSQNRVRVAGNRYVPDKEVNYKTPWTPAGIFEVLGATVSGNSIGDADQYFILRNSNGVPLDVRFLTDSVSDVHSTLTIQTAISQAIATRAQFTITGAFSPGANNTYDIGDSTNRWKEIFATNGVINTSDERTKDNIKELSLGLDFINSLRPIEYKAKEGKVELTSKLVKEAVYDDDGNLLEAPVYEQVVVHKPGTRIHTGLSAQQVKSVIPSDFDFAGWTLADPSDPDSLQSLRYTEFIGILIKAVQELNEKVDGSGV